MIAFLVISLSSFVSENHINAEQAKRESKILIVKLMFLKQVGGGSVSRGGAGGSRPGWTWGSRNGGRWDFYIFLDLCDNSERFLNSRRTLPIQN